MSEAAKPCPKKEVVETRFLRGRKTGAFHDTSVHFRRRKQGGYIAPFTDLGLQANIIAELSLRREGLQLLGLLLNSPGQLLFVS